MYTEVRVIFVSKPRRAVRDIFSYSLPGILETSPAAMRIPFVSKAKRVPNEPVIWQPLTGVYGSVTSTTSGHSIPFPLKPWCYRELRRSGRR